MNCGCDINKPENCKFCACVGNPGGFGYKQLCHCCDKVKRTKDQSKTMEMLMNPEKFANPNCRFCRGNGRFQTMSGFCVCINHP